MKAAELFRVNDTGVETLGNFSIAMPDKAWKVFSLERPWKNNNPDTSCVPAGTYHCSYTRSPHLSIIAGRDVFTYELLNVPGRLGIRIHSANFYYQLEGCIALGFSLGDVNKDGQTDILQSRDAILQLHELMNGEDFELTIHDIPNQPGILNFKWI